MKYPQTGPAFKPMQLHLAPRHGGWAGCLFFPDLLAHENCKRPKNLIVSKQLSRLNEQ